MHLNIEQLLRESNLRYTKEVSPPDGERFSLPFETPNGLVRVDMAQTGDSLVVSTLLRSLDSLQVPNVRDLYHQLLELNSAMGPARAFIWRDEDEIDWVGVVANILAIGLGSSEVAWAIGETAHMAGEVLEVLEAHTQKHRGRAQAGLLGGAEGPVP